MGQRCCAPNSRQLDQRRLEQERYVKSRDGSAVSSRRDVTPTSRVSEQGTYTPSEYRDLGRDIRSKSAEATRHASTSNSYYARQAVSGNRDFERADTNGNALRARESQRAMRTQSSNYANYDTPTGEYSQSFYRENVYRQS